MAFFYLDSSALVKRYNVESGSDFLHHLFADPIAVLYACRLAYVETLCALARQAKLGHLPAEAHARTRDQFLYEWELRIRSLDVTDMAWRRAAILGPTHCLRSLDAIHLAVALDWLSTIPSLKEEEISFLTSDGPLAEAARLEGFHVIDPST